MKKEIFRKLIHLSSLIYPLLYLFFFEKRDMLILTFSLFLFLSVIDFARYKFTNFASFINKIFGIFSRESEKNGGIYGSTYFMCGVFFTILLFEKGVAIASILVLIISDTCASLVGKSIKSPKLYGEKSLSGFLAFFISALVILFYFTQNVTVALITAFLTSVCELFAKKVKIDDNLLIPITSGVFLYLFS